MAPLGVNAIAVAGKLLRELSDIEHELRLRPQDPRFDPPYATLQVTRIDGGTATNIVPVSCRLDFDVRAIPGVDVAAIDRRIRAFAANVCLPEMRKVAPEARSISPSPIRCRRSRPDRAPRSVALALKLAGQNETHAVSYATEAGLFQVAGSPAVVMRPRRHRAGAHRRRVDRQGSDRQVQCISFPAR